MSTESDGRVAQAQIAAEQVAEGRGWPSLRPKCVECGALPAVEDMRCATCLTRPLSPEVEARIDRAAARIFGESTSEARIPVAARRERCE